MKLYIADGDWVGALVVMAESKEKARELFEEANKTLYYPINLNKISIEEHEPNVVTLTQGDK